tara:strand:+ start:633 stop:1205 length:573 start_codon:yes stop_codon:yes gene_type:complete
MKKKNILLILLLSFGTTHVKSQEKIIDLTSSNIKWTGKEITTKIHYGSLKFNKGKITLKNGLVTGGKFIVDMKSLANQDLSGGSKNYLENHLRSDDFFGVEQYPTAILNILSSKKIDGDKFSVQGDLIIKGISNPTSFTLEFNDKGAASAELVFDRSKYNVKFRSSSFFDELGDKLIYDDIELKVDLVFN